MPHQYFVQELPRHPRTTAALPNRLGEMARDDSHLLIEEFRLHHSGIQDPHNQTILAQAELPVQLCQICLILQNLSTAAWTPLFTVTRRLVTWNLQIAHGSLMLKYNIRPQGIVIKSAKRPILTGPKPD